MLHQQSRRQIIEGAQGSNKKIKLFMDAQKEILNNIYPSLGDLYYNYRDEWAISLWDQLDGAFVWADLVSHCNMYSRGGLSRLFRPFCLYNQRIKRFFPSATKCCKCKYARNHNGRCGRYRSDHWKMTVILDGIEEPLTRIFSSANYIKISSEIEKNN